RVVCLCRGTCIAAKVRQEPHHLAATARLSCSTVSGDDSLLIPDGAVLEAFALAAAPLTRATSGLINPTWYVRSKGGVPLVLQRVNPIFSAAVNEDIAAVTEHLAAKGVMTPRLVAARSGALWIEHRGAVWRGRAGDVGADDAQ